MDADAKDSNRGRNTIVVTIVDAGSTLVFLQIAAKAAHLQELGMSNKAIARALGVTDKTVAKANRVAALGDRPGRSDHS